MFSLKTADIVQSLKDLDSIPEGKVLINTINAHSYNWRRRILCLPRLFWAGIT